MSKNYVVQDSSEYTSIHTELVPIKHTIGEVTFSDEDTVYKLDVKEDVTPLESANLSLLLLHGFNSYVAMYDFTGFIKEKKLERHFEINS